MSKQFKGIPVVTGSKISKLNGTRAIKNGMKASSKHSAVPIGRKPDWLRVRLPTGPKYQAMKKNVHEHRLSTVCEESMCPNIGECWSHGTATIMILGDTYTRACKFCAVDTGNPHGWLDHDEPDNCAETAEIMGLKYMVITSVDRDDLPDGGARHYADCVEAIKRRNPGMKVEALTPDFAGVYEHVNTVVDSSLDVFAQNVETVERLTHVVRDPRAGYGQTLDVLRHAKQRRPDDLLTKTSLMLGLGETEDEIHQTLVDIRAAGVDIVTLGQYMRPTVNHLPIERYVPPADFSKYRQWALDLGFLEAVAGPFVRSSYRAERVFDLNNAGLEETA